MNNNKDGGFTLIELLIVIVILGILAAVVVFSVTNVRDNAAKNACLTEKKTVQTANEAYYAENGAYPATLSSLVPDYLSADPEYFTVTNGVIGSVAPLPDQCTLP